MILSSKSDFIPAPEGVHNAVCVDVVDLGLVATQFGPKHKCRFVFQIDAKMPDTQKRFIVQQRFTASLHPKSGLHKFLKQWRGKDFTKEELETFDTEKLVGVNAQIVIQHDEKDGQVYGNITAIMKPKVKMTPDKDYIRFKDRPENQTQDAEAPEGMDAPPSETEPF